MANEIVKYHNDLNLVEMSGWNAKEMNFFFTITSKIRDKGTSSVVLDPEEVRELSGFSSKNRKRWEDTMFNVADKITRLNYLIRDEKRVRAMNLFSDFDVNLEEQEVVVQVSPNFEYVFSDLDANFTTYKLEEILSLKSVYAKTAYRLLKQWRTVGVREFEINEFRGLFDVPDTYLPGDIKRRAIDPIIKELGGIFSGLHCEVLRKRTRGKPVSGYRFTFEPEKRERFDKNKYSGKKKEYIRQEPMPDWVNKESKSETKDENLGAMFADRLEKMRNFKGSE